MPLTARIGLPVVWAVAMPLIELVCPGPPVTIDTPGVRAFGLWGVDRPNLQHYFEEFGPYLNDCRLPACTHIHEPDCAVQAALADGAIPEARYESYCDIYDSLPAEPLHRN